MPTGLATTWGYPIGAVANNYKTMLDGDHPLTYEESLTSYPPSFAAGYFQSPLVPIATRNEYKGSVPVSAFGRKSRRKTRRTRRKTKGKKKIPAKIRRQCKRLKIKMTRKVGKRRVPKTLKQLKKQIARKLKALRKKKH
jgi:hypothetical protein